MLDYPRRRTGCSAEISGPDRKALDAWAAERTGGLVDAMPVELTPLTELVLASALVLRTTWEEPFEGGYGHWLGSFERAGLTRMTEGLDDLAVARTPAGKVTRVTVRGDNGIDVHLLLGEEEMTPGQVLCAGLDCLDGSLKPTVGGRLKLGAAGPGLHVSTVRTAQPGPSRLSLATVEFTLTARHDLLARPELFGLSCAGDPAWGGFPGISAAPLGPVVKFPSSARRAGPAASGACDRKAPGRPRGGATWAVRQRGERACQASPGRREFDDRAQGVGSAGQSVTAAFSAEGFRAAAVTAAGMAWMGGPGGDPPYETTKAHVRIDRPFGFLVVHRETCLVLVAGWVTEPGPGDEDEFSG